MALCPFGVQYEWPECISSCFSACRRLAIGDRDGDEHEEALLEEIDDIDDISRVNPGNHEIWRFCCPHSYRATSVLMPISAVVDRVIDGANAKHNQSSASLHHRKR